MRNLFQYKMVEYSKLATRLENAKYVRAHQINNNPCAKCSLFAYLSLRTYLYASAQY